MRALNAPLARVEVVGSVSEVFHEAEHHAAIAHSHYSAWQGGVGEGNTLASQIGYCCGIVKFCHGKRLAVEHGG